MSRINRKWLSIIRLTSAWAAAPRKLQSFPDRVAKGSNRSGLKRNYRIQREASGEEHQDSLGKAWGPKNP
jgi:hypothetical protein